LSQKRAVPRIFLFQPTWLGSTESGTFGNANLPRNGVRHRWPALKSYLHKSRNCRIGQNCNVIVPTIMICCTMMQSRSASSAPCDRQQPLALEMPIIESYLHLLFVDFVFDKAPIPFKCSMMYGSNLRLEIQGRVRSCTDVLLEHRERLPLRVGLQESSRNHRQQKPS
jgi:hypothetical protein